MNVAETLLDALRRQPDRPAVIRGRRVVTAGALAVRAQEVSAALHARGLHAGDTVALAVRPGPQSLAVVLGATRIGLRVALVDPAAGPDLVRTRLRAADARLVLADSVVQAAAGWAAPAARRAGLHLPVLEEVAPVVTLGRRLPGSAPALAPGRHDPGPQEADDALVVFTSGTTGRPRAVVHQHASLAAGIDVVRGLVDPAPGEPVLGGTFFVMAPAILAGAPVVLPPRRPWAVARALAAHRPGTTYLTPPQLRDLLATGAPLRGRVFTGSAPAPASLLRRVKEAGAREAWGVYAMTEAFPVAAVEEKDKSAYAGAGDLVGRPLGGVRVRADADGQLWVAGPQVCGGYLGEDPHEEVATGDRGSVRDDSVVLEGRLKDMILRRAENIYPGLHEPGLHLPGVASVIMVGVPDAEGDEEVVLVVEPDPGVAAADVRARLKAPLAALGPARPDRVVIGEVPRSGRSRKPDRAEAVRRLQAAGR